MKKIAAFILGFAIGLAGGVGYYSYKHHKSATPNNTVHSTIYDTTYYRLPTAYDSVVLRYQTKYVKVNQTVIDSVIVRSEDSIPVKIPITQKIYKDSLYEAWISGYEPNLDSINVFGKTVTTTIYKATPVYKTKRWGLGVQAGYGYGKKGFSPYIGIGIQYNIYNW